MLRANGEPGNAYPITSSEGLVSGLVSEGRPHLRTNNRRQDSYCGKIKINGSDRMPNRWNL